MLVYIIDRDDKELPYDYPGGLAHIYDQEDRSSSDNYSYVYVDEYDYDYLENEVEQTNEYEIDYDIGNNYI